MDPAAYKSMTEAMKRVFPQSAIGRQENEPSGQPKPVDTNWTVSRPDVTRGNLTMETAPGDPRMAVGWRADSRSAPRQLEEMPWMSTTQQQPFLWSGEPIEKSAEATTESSSTPASTYPHPDLSLPHPSLRLDFRMSVTLNPRISVGPTPLGHRNWISFTGGTWFGSWGSGIVLPGGQDSQIIIPNGSSCVETTYLLQTHDNPPAHIMIKTRGWRTGPPDVLAQLNDPRVADKVNPNSYKFRLFIDMETGDERYRDQVNCGMWVGSGMRNGTELIYE
ncbi:Uncharacterized protein BP5553_00978 [Venustampulla echinocandica]|uniref:Outer membrane protein, beta-barrel n=1 Tax=Venustampulla echinocandica TaxID=2656787 RepID=A0A370TZP1_9HELO|nr:Uncharacterized protein BP5553_00978 [Venustampulla echinocandica]RDL40999.1 Uncharacterized protein BP5553_00978 [Venustampulla echinocandica]